MAVVTIAAGGHRSGTYCILKISDECLVFSNLSNIREMMIHDTVLMLSVNAIHVQVRLIESSATRTCGRSV